MNVENLKSRESQGVNPQYKRITDQKQPQNVEYTFYQRSMISKGTRFTREIKSNFCHGQRCDTENKFKTLGHLFGFIIRMLELYCYCIIYELMRWVAHVARMGEERWVCRILSVNFQYDMQHCCVYSEKILLMMDRGTVRNIQIYSKNKFKKLAHLFGFIIRMLELQCYCIIYELKEEDDTGASN